MVDSGRTPTDWQHLRAAVVSVCDNCVSRHGCSARHGSCDFFGRFECHSRYRGSASAKKRAERTCSSEETREAVGATGEVMRSMIWRSSPLAG